METRGSVRRAANQQRAAEHFTQEWLRRQGPGAAVALERIQNLTRNGEHGDVIIDPGPVARATPATFAETSPTSKRTASHGIPIPYQPPSWKNASTCAVNLPRKRVKTIVPDLRGLDESLPKHRLVSTRAQTRKLTTDEKAEIFERILVPVVASGYLMWYEFLRVGGVSRACRALWIHRRETYGPWKKVLKELNGINGTNKCSRCEQEVTLRLYRTFCDSDLWNEECRKRTPDFVSCVDILMSSGFLTWRECGGIRRICKETYKMYKGQCTCRRNIVDRTPNRPFLKIDPRFQADYNLWTDYEKCEALIRYTHFLVRNLRSFYNFGNLTSNEKLPYGLAAWDWTDIQAINLQTQCPNRYAFVMNLVSLNIAQGELHRCPPVWFTSAFLGFQHNPYVEQFADSISSELTDQCLPPTDENLVNYLRNRCYPSLQQQRALGPLVNGLFIFAPLFKVVPLRETIGPTKLPQTLESLNEQLVESMSQHVICTIM
ncbi:hypothetical protein IV203_007182 [Nitzschia inconspicua]|uniref:Uncharacterized protein n=1 Tax=Nitzschia inconspicua TaxID=303405 RepID=A0A9K3KFD8_9STRA|nr:hypothetical protein IV203_007182 [Nitzschia inconspicua]